jgi:transcriptional regulator with XRE-family HTH domain
MRQRRRMLDLSQREVADLVGVHRNAVLYWERGQRMPTALQLAKVARVLGSPPWTLFDVVDQQGDAVSDPWKGHRR